MLVLISLCLQITKKYYKNSSIEFIDQKLNFPILYAIKRILIVLFIQDTSKTSRQLLYFMRNKFLVSKSHWLLHGNYLNGVVNSSIYFLFRFVFISIESVKSISQPPSANPMELNRQTLKIYVSWPPHTLTKSGRTFKKITSSHMTKRENEKGRERKKECTETKSYKLNF